jgi:hypothetical protein
MATMTEGYRNAIATSGGALITHIGLVDETGTELSGGSPAYARKTVTWTTAAAGIIRPDANLVFDIPAGKIVAGWRGFTALGGGTNYGGPNLTQETFVAQGTYTLLAASSGIKHENPA